MNSRQVLLPLRYKKIAVEDAYRLDILIEGQLIIEVKSVEKIEKVHEAQLLTYLCLSGIQLGLLLNFSVPYMKDGIKRMIL